MADPPGHTACGNCDAPLTGPYCAQCGQHAHESARTIGVLMHDAWHVLTHVDGRLWRTAYTILLLPGKLTQEYFAARRARYLPPVRVYLVLSVLFFAFGSLSSELTSDAPEAPPQQPPRPAATPSSINQADDDGAVHIGFADNLFGNYEDCGKIRSTYAWLQKRMRDSCDRYASDHGERVKAAYLHNIPRMMFLFVPLIALAMLLLYWRPRRYYVEHVVFFLHNHAAIFLILLLQSLLVRLLSPFGWTRVDQWLGLLMSLYTLWYVYRAMRVYYGQGRWLTTGKFLLVGVAYTAAMTATLLMTFFITALF